MAALVAPGEGVLPSLEELNLSENQVCDTGTLVGMLSSGVTPLLKCIYVSGNPSTPTGAANEALF